MCAIADFYGFPDLQTVARHKFRVALARLHDVPGLLELVCNPQFQGDAELRDNDSGQVIRRPQFSRVNHA